jgi:hypothetical protein
LEKTMATLILFRAAAVLLALGTLGHTLGGMLGTARKGPEAGAEADRVLAEMKGVRFQWRGGDCTWFGFWMGNGLGVSALLVLAVSTLWILGSAVPGQAGPLLSLASIVTAVLGILAALGVRYFAPRVGAVFGLVAALSLAGTVLLAIGAP